MTARLQREPDECEKHAQRFLSHRGHATVYEPDGNVAPDFLVDGRIAVEVRRLNQNHRAADGRVEGIEQALRSLTAKVKQVAYALPGPEGESWFIGIDFRRPVENWRTLHPKIKRGLQAFIDKPHRAPTEVDINPNLTISFFQASRPHPTFFVMGGVMDEHAGGWLIEELATNIDICIAEKSQKVDRAKYKEWWLILVDRTGLGFCEDDDYPDLRRSIAGSGAFDKVIFLHAEDQARSYDVFSVSPQS